MTSGLPVQLAFAFASLCLGGILLLMLLVTVVSRRQNGVDASDGCLSLFFSLLLAIAALMALAVSIFG